MSTWKDLSGDRRIAAELKYMQTQVRKGHPQLFNIVVVDDNLRCWRFEVKNFDADVQGGRQLNDDLRRLACEYGQDHILMEAIFPQDYPNEPFLLRVVSPRCMMYTGHVTMGGSLCIQALVSTPGGWQADYSFESIMALALVNMVDCESVHVMTRAGSGMSGPVRIDFEHRSHRVSVMTPYTEADARSAYNRSVANHAAQGWEGTASNSAAATRRGRVHFLNQSIMSHPRAASTSSSMPPPHAILTAPWGAPWRRPGAAFGGLGMPTLPPPTSRPLSAPFKSRRSAAYPFPDESPSVVPPATSASTLLPLMAARLSAAPSADRSSHDARDAPPAPTIAASVPSITEPTPSDKARSAVDVRPKSTLAEALPPPPPSDDAFVVPPASPAHTGHDDDGVAAMEQAMSLSMWLPASRASLARRHGHGCVHHVVIDLVSSDDDQPLDKRRRLAPLSAAVGVLATDAAVVELSTQDGEAIRHLSTTAAMVVDIVDVPSTAAAAVLDGVAPVPDARDSGGLQQLLRAIDRIGSDSFVAPAAADLGRLHRLASAAVLDANEPVVEQAVGVHNKEHLAGSIQEPVADLAAAPLVRAVKRKAEEAGVDTAQAGELLAKRSASTLDVAAVVSTLDVAAVAFTLDVAAAAHTPCTCPPPAFTDAAAGACVALAVVGAATHAVHAFDATPSTPQSAVVRASVGSPPGAPIAASLAARRDVVSDFHPLATASRDVVSNSRPLPTFQTRADAAQTPVIGCDAAAAAAMLTNEGGGVTVRVTLPKAWAPMPAGDKLLLVELPLPEVCADESRAYKQVEESQAFKKALKTLRGNGLTKQDARDLLCHHNGQLEAALMFCVKACDEGGVTQALRRLRATASSAVDPAAEVAPSSQPVPSSLERDEVEMVLKRCSKSPST